MKTPLKYLTIVALAIAVLTWLPSRTTATEGEDEGGGLDEHVAAREAYRHMMLQDENGEISPDALIQAYHDKKGMPYLSDAWAEFMQGDEPEDVEGSKPGVLHLSDPGILTDILVDVDPSQGQHPWVSVGPPNIGGRIRSLIIHPTATPRTIWVGAVNGGVWKTIDDGAHWSTNTDFLANIGVHCMAIDPANPDILYIGTGEGDHRGGGIFKTTDGGDTWRRLPNTVPSLVTENYWSFVNSLAICPTNSQLILAATSDQSDYVGKIYRSTNGGEDWSLIDTPASANVVNITDVRFSPEDFILPIINCIAGTVGNGAYYSSNGGVTWTTASWGPIPSNEPPSGRVELGYSRSNPSIVYASVGSNGGMLYRSTDGGQFFDLRLSGPPTGPGGAPGGTGVGGYSNALWVDPIDPETVIVGSVLMWRSTSGGNGGWEEASTTSTHVDHHAIVEDPGYNRGTGGPPNANAIVYGGNDGGIFKAANILFPCPSPARNCVDGIGWNSLDHALVNTQFYGAAGHVATGRFVGGTQDNGTLVSPAPGSSEPNWTLMAGSLGGDGGFAAVDQTSNPYFYGEFFFLQIYRSIDGGYTKGYIYNADPAHIITDADYSDGEHGFYANAVAPFILEPNDANGNTILAGGAHLWRSTNVRGASPSPSPAWFVIKEPIVAPGQFRNISAVAVAPGDSNIIWVGHNDGSIYYTTNGTDPTPNWTLANTGLPSRMCTRVAVGGNVQGTRTVYATFGGFSGSNVWKTQNNGQSWIPISTGLPQVPVYSLVISPSNPHFIYIGTEIGVFASSDSGTTWSPGNGGPANAPVFELFWMGPKLVAATYGRGIFTIQR